MLFRSWFDEVKTAATEKIGDRESYVVAGINSGEIAAKFYFDKESGYLLRILRYTKSPLGRNPTEIDYSDFRDVAGVKIPFKRVVSQTFMQATLELVDVQPNVSIQAATFVKPR